MAWGKKAIILSTIIIVSTLGLFTYRVIKNHRSVLAVDLTGGTSIICEIDETKGDVDIAKVRKAVEEVDNTVLIQTYEKGGKKMLSINTGLVSNSDNSKSTKDGVDTNKTSAQDSANVANTGDEDSKSEDDPENKIKACLEKAGITNLVVKSSESISASVGADLRKSGSKAVLFSLIGILIYIGFRFRFGFALGGIVALAHDALIAFGLFSLCGRQVSLIVITALLTIIGYSINDTVVVFDRIREMLKRDSRTPLKDICNAAINSCLGRTVITSLTTFFTVAVLFIFTDGSIYDFALTMLFGVVAGTYSSIFIATPVMAWWYRKNRPSFDDEEPKKEVM
jgi:preprotein translocase SecF subunit